MYDDWGMREARALMTKRKRGSEDNFDKIFWEGVAAAMIAYPQMFRVYITKHVENVCPCCGVQDESTGHITRCTDEGRTEMFYESVDILCDFLSETHMDGRLIDCIATYLEHRGEKTMTSITHRMPLFATIAADIDALGWDCLLEGRIPTSLVDLQL
eukprot:scaffold4090_cov21-Cyclotella_meneghiniana.AAC.2